MQVGVEALAVKKSLQKFRDILLDFGPCFRSRLARIFPALIENAHTSANIEIARPAFKLSCNGVERFSFLIKRYYLYWCHTIDSLAKTSAWFNQTRLINHQFNRPFSGTIEDSIKREKRSILL